MTPVAGRQHLRCEYCSSFWFPPESDEGVQTVNEPVDHVCPVCVIPLVAGTIEELPVAHCTKCRGILAKTRDFFEIVKTRKAKATGPFAPERPVDRSELSRLLACPACKETMGVHPYLGPGNAVIDTCGNCLLVWLDHSELTVIVNAKK